MSTVSCVIKYYITFTSPGLNRRARSDQLLRTNPSEKGLFLDGWFHEVSTQWTYWLSVIFMIIYHRCPKNVIIYNICWCFSHLFHHHKCPLHCLQISRRMEMQKIWSKNAWNKIIFYEVALKVRNVFAFSCYICVSPLSEEKSFQFLT